VRVPLAVTTSGQPLPALEARARERAQAWGLPFHPRPARSPLAPLLATVADAFLVFGRDGVTLWDAQGHFGFHPGLAHLRLQRLAAGEGDTLVRMADLREGDAVLDCTLGLAQDALVAARAVGPRGRVVGVEKSLALHAVVSEGLRRQGPLADACPVEPVHADAHTFLCAQGPRSFDVVLFDPMFAKARPSQPSFEVLRRHAEHARLAPETLEEARRVARRWVVVKGARYTDDLSRLGLAPLPGSRFASVAWARTPALAPG
jgi:16S rRNA (guanine1516-N2)-methyltransferase